MHNHTVSDCIGQNSYPQSLRLTSPINTEYFWILLVMGSPKVLFRFPVPLLTLGLGHHGGVAQRKSVYTKVGKMLVYINSDQVFLDMYRCGYSSHFFRPGFGCDFGRALPPLACSRW